MLDSVNVVFHGESQAILKEYPDSFFDLCITSPPYKKKDGYSPTLVKTVMAEVYRVLKPDSLAFVNFGHLVEDKVAPLDVLSACLSVGFEINDYIIWVKKQFSPIQGNKRLNNLFEYIFFLYKGKMPEIDRLSIGVPYKDKNNIGRYSKKDIRCRGNVWEIGYETIQKRSQKFHKDRFPVELPENCIKLSAISDRERPVVLDCFAGSSSTAIACIRQDVNFVMIDRDSNYVDISKERIANELEKCKKT